MFKIYGVLLLSLICSSCLSSNAMAQSTVCTGMHGIDVLQGVIPANPEAELLIPPGGDGAGADGFPDQEWTELSGSQSPITVRCFKNATDNAPAETVVLKKVPSSCNFAGGIMSCK